MFVRNSPWIVRRVPRDAAALRLFLLPHAGAGSVIYRDWHTAFPDSVDVCAIEPPGRFARRKEPQITEVKQFARAMAGAIQPYLDVPYAFFGYSLGALMSFECARALRRERGLQPAQLIVAAHKAPQLPCRNPISRAPRPAFIRELERRYGAFEPAIKTDPEMLDLVVEMMRIDMAMLEDYQYREEERFACPIVAIGGTQDVSLDSSELEAWRAHTSAEFRSFQVPGAHFFLRTHVPQLRALVSEALGPILSRSSACALVGM